MVDKVLRTFSGGAPNISIVTFSRTTTDNIRHRHRQTTGLYACPAVPMHSPPARHNSLLRVGRTIRGRGAPTMTIMLHSLCISAMPLFVRFHAGSEPFQRRYAPYRCVFQLYLKLSKDNKLHLLLATSLYSSSQTCPLCKYLSCDGIEPQHIVKQLQVFRTSFYAQGSGARAYR